MTVKELRERIAVIREHLKENSGSFMVASEDGPIGIKLIDDVADVLADLEARIKKLEGKGGSGYAKGATVVPPENSVRQ